MELSEKISPTNTLQIKLRKIIQSAISRHQYTSAMFYADKLLTISNEPKYDIVLFADVCYSNKEYHRGLHTLRKAGLLEPYRNIQNIQEYTCKAFHIAALCMLAMDQKMECIQLLESILPNEDIILTVAESLNQCMDEEDSINLIATLVLLLGEANEAIGKQEKAIQYYKLAVRCDPKCTDAFFSLVDKSLLSPEQEVELLENIEFPEDDTGILLQLLYRSHIDLYDITAFEKNELIAIETPIDLTKNYDMEITKAEKAFNQNDLPQAYKICVWLDEKDPYNPRLTKVYVCTLVALNKKRDLYAYANKMVEIYPDKAIAWYAVGCYYFAAQKFDQAERYFHKSTHLDPTFGHGWIGFGNACAQLDESDQAMSAYRTALSIYPGSHLPRLYIGMEYLRTDSLAQALEYIQQAADICPKDPLVFNEMGSVYLKLKDYKKAIEMLTKSLDLYQSHITKKATIESSPNWVPTLFNLGYAYRKLQDFNAAIHYFQRALRLSPRSASAHAALGFTFHLQGNFNQAIECYHSALLYQPDEPLAGEMIGAALEESLEASDINDTVNFNLYKPRRVLDNDEVSKNNKEKESEHTYNDVSQGALSRKLNLEQSFSSIERSQQSISITLNSSLELSDDSEMTIDDN